MAGKRARMLEKECFGKNAALEYLEQQLLSLVELRHLSAKRSN